MSLKGQTWPKGWIKSKKKKRRGIEYTCLKRRRIYDTNSNAIGVFLKNLDAIIAKESSCDNLIPLYQSNFEENKNNAIWLNRAAGRMKSKECADALYLSLLLKHFMR